MNPLSMTTLAATTPESIINWTMFGLTAFLILVVVIGFLVGLTRRLWLNIVKFVLFGGLLLVAIFANKAIANSIMNYDLHSIWFVGKQIPESFVLSFGESSSTIAVTTPLETATELVKALYQYGGITYETAPELGDYVVQLAVGIVRYMLFFVMVLLILIIIPIVTGLIRLFSWIFRKKENRSYKKPLRRLGGGLLSSGTSLMVLAAFMIPITSFIHTVNSAFKDENNVAPADVANRQVYDITTAFLDAYEGSFFDWVMFGGITNNEGKTLDNIIVDYITVGEIEFQGEKVDVSINDEIKSVAGLYHAFSAAGVLDNSGEIQIGLLFKTETINSLFYNLKSSGLIMSALPIVIQVLFDQPFFTEAIHDEQIRENFKEKVTSLTRSEYEKEFDAIKDILLVIVEHEVMNADGTLNLGHLYNETVITDLFAGLTKSKILRESYPVLVDLVISLEGVEEQLGAESVEELRDSARELPEEEYENEIIVLRDILISLVESGALTEQGSFEIAQLYKSKTITDVFDAVSRSMMLTSTFPVLANLIADTEPFKNAIGASNVDEFKANVAALDKSDYANEVKNLGDILVTFIDAGVMSPTTAFNANNLMQSAPIKELFAEFRASKLFTASFPLIMNMFTESGALDSVIGPDLMPQFKANIDALPESAYKNELSVIEDLLLVFIDSKALTPSSDFDFNKIYNKGSMNGLFDAIGDSELFLESFAILIESMFEAQGLNNAVPASMYPKLITTIRGLDKDATSDEIDAVQNIINKLFDSGQADLLNEQIATSGESNDNSFYDSLLDPTKMANLITTLRAIDGVPASGTTPAQPKSVIMSNLMPAQIAKLAEDDGFELLEIIMPDTYEEFDNYQWGAELSTIFESLAEMMLIDPEVSNLMSGNPSNSDYDWTDLIQANKSEFRKALIGDKNNIDPLTGRSNTMATDPAFLDSDLVMENIDQIMDIMFADFRNSTEVKYQIASVYFDAKLAGMDDDDIVQKRLNYKEEIDELIDIFVSADDLVTIDPENPPALEDLPQLPEIDPDEWEDIVLPPWINDLIPDGMLP